MCYIFQFHKRFSKFDAADIFVKASRLLLVECLPGLRQHYVMKILCYPLSRGEISPRENARQIFCLKFGMHRTSQNKTKTTKINRVNFIIIETQPFKRRKCFIDIAFELCFGVGHSEGPSKPGRT